MSRIRFIAIVLLWTLVGHADEAPEVPQGQLIYQERCASCHGDRGEGVAGAYDEQLVGDMSLPELAKVIHDTMPEGEPEACRDGDARVVAAYIHDAFYSEAAQVRNNPPRFRVAHFTGLQLRRSLADIYAHFQSLMPPLGENGLRGRYYAGTQRNNESMKIERVDTTIEFDFGHEGPGSGIPGDEFAVQWSGAIRADDTGLHEIVIRSTSAFMCYLGASNREFINNNVQSGDQTEFRQSIVLTAGQLVPIRIDFYQRKRKTEQPPASFSLAWKTPGSVERLIPTYQLFTVDAPPMFSLQTKLPPDDRTYGYERGIAVDRQWDEATTEAAIEFADVVANDLWAKASGRDRGRRRGRRSEEAPTEDASREKLRAFLLELVETGFRQPLGEELEKLYIDEQLAATEDDQEAITRVVVAMIKSPRFLYPTVDSTASPSHRAATRLALTLFDSIPSDAWLIEAADTNQLEETEAVRAAARRMLDDYRTRGKVRGLLYAWLNLQRGSDIVKDAAEYPEFQPELVADLRQSLDMFLDEVVWSESSDFRQLLRADWAFTNTAIAKFYGDDWLPAPAPHVDDQVAEGVESGESSDTSRGELDLGFRRTASHPGRFAGVLTHPYLTSSLAYQDASSPIHRGVFLYRFALGRNLRPPQASFSPLSPDLHPDLTTRQRVSLQTFDENCQACHAKINGLGFALENYDAVGRYREQDNNQDVDARGIYTTRAGEMVEFAGAVKLSEFMAASPDVHSAFVDRAFEHFTKQPAAAYGLGTLDEVTEKFVNSNFNIRELIVEIAVIAATRHNGDVVAVHEEATEGK
jgi:mono/diheme cytochrome c family protein